MKQIPSDKYSVAWFTLAECVSRGEKVRAMSLYRLLAHSIEDNAFTSQLKGDLLLAFEDTTAVELYEEAAELYLKDNRLLEAAGIYEHLLTLVPDKPHYMKSLVKLYDQLSINSKVISYLHQLFEMAIAQNDIASATNVVARISEIEDQSTAIQANQRLVFMLLKQKQQPRDIIVLHGKKVVDGLIPSDDKKALQQFLTTIEALNVDCYKELSEYLESEYGMVIDK